VPVRSEVKEVPVALYEDPKTRTAVRCLDGRNSVRTLADALSKLQEVGGLAKHGTVLIQVARLEFPDGSDPGQVAVTPAKPGPGGRWTVLIPLASSFSATGTLGERRTFAIDDLNQAVSDPEGNVQLADGTCVHALELVPVPVHYDLDHEQEKILRSALRAIGAEDQCLRRLHEMLPFEVLDYARVAKAGRERLPSLKAIHRDVLKEFPDLSRQKLARVLAMAGLKRPRSGPRARAG